MGLRTNLRSFSAAARSFLAGAALLEVGHAFQWALLNLYITSLGYSVADAGTVNAAIAVAVVLSTLPAAWLYDRLGPRLSLSLACLANVTAMVGVALSTDLSTMAAWAAVSGAGNTLHTVVAAPFLVSVSEGHQRTQLFQWEFAVHTAMQCLGLAVSGALAGLLQGALLGETGALRAALIIGGMVSLSALWPYRRLPVRADAEDVADQARARGRMLSILHPSQWHLWVRLSAPHFLVGAGAGLSIPFINLYFTDRFVLPKTALGVVMGASAATMTVGALYAPRIVSRLGLLKATILTEALSIPFFLVMAFTGHLPLAIAAFVLRGALMNLSGPLWRNLMMEMTPPAWRAAVNGVSMLCWHLGWALSNHWGGVLIDTSAGWLGADLDGYALPMLMTIGAYVTAITLEATFFWRVRHLGRTAGTNPAEAAGPGTT